MNEHYGFRGEYGRPHFPVFPMLLIPLGIGFVLGMKRHARMSGMYGPGGEHRHGPFGRQEWKNGVPPFFAELHRRAHEADKQQPETTEA